MAIDARAVAGYVVAWMIRRARRAGDPADTAIDAGLDELHRVVAAKLDAEPALAAAQAEAVEGNEVADPTRQRVAAAVAEAVRADDPFGQAVTRLVARVRDAEAAAGSAVFTGDAHVTVHGGIGVGQVSGDVTVYLGATPVMGPVRSRYREQVKRIAPPRLLGREAELAELARFCLEDGAGAYRWWQAEPWAGKSALLSTFLLHPPEGPLWLVAFFVTARLADQENRAAFTTALTDQLCHLLDEERPPAGSEATQEAAMLDLLGRAAARCESAGGRLVLVVDGLDEDRTAGPDGPSIAGLLPAEPPAGMRIVVAGRPNPPLPSDVVPWHPLRSRTVIQALTPSPHARNLRELGAAELRRLLRGSEVERHLLGLLTAARGGLSGPDLRELTRAGLVDIEDVLHGVAGRTFTRRAAEWSGEVEVYLLGHEELFREAVRYLGDDRLAGYRDQLHAWAGTYRAWPASTPEYLLTGYPRMLAAAGDTERLLALGTDPDRHERLLDMSGGDVAALNEIAHCQDMFLKRPEIDLFSLALLAHYRTEIEVRNANLPPSLPAVWALLGQPTRAETLAHSIRTRSEHRAMALSDVAGAVASTGDVARAERIATGIATGFWRGVAMDKIAAIRAEAGETDDAVRLARAADDRTETHARTLLARHLSEGGRYEQAERIAGTARTGWRSLAHAASATARAEGREAAEALIRDSSGDSEECAVALASTAATLAAAGDRDHVGRLLDEAEQEAGADFSRLNNSETRLRVAELAAAAGEAERARTIVEREARGDDHLKRGFSYLIGAGASAARLGMPGLARDVFGAAELAARESDHFAESFSSLTELASEMARAGERDSALRLVTEIELAARRFVRPSWRARTLVYAAEAAARVGHSEVAERIAGQIEHDDSRTHALSLIAHRMIDAGDLDGAERIAGGLTGSYAGVRIRRRLVDSLARAGDPAGAMLVVEKIREIWYGADTFDELVRGVLETGDEEAVERFVAGIPKKKARDRARAKAQAATAVRMAGAGDLARAEQTASAIVRRGSRERALAEVSVALARQGRPRRAERLARSLTRHGRRAEALRRVAVAAARAGRLDHAERIAGTLLGKERQTAFAHLVALAAEADDLDRAQRAVREIRKEYLRIWALGDIVPAAVRAGEQVLAESLAGEAESRARGIGDPYARCQVLTYAARAAFHAGRHGAADTLIDESESVRDGVNSGRRPPARSLTSMIVSAAEQGEVVWAERMAGRIGDAGQRGGALSAIAEVVGPPEADRLLGEALAIGPWQSSIGEMAGLHPGLIVPFLERILPEARTS